MTTTVPAPASSSSTPEPSAQAATAAALASYRGYWAAQVKAQADPAGDIPESLQRYAIDTALANVESAVLLYRQQGIELRGAPVIAPEVVGVVLGPNPSVSIRDCVDSTGWVPVFAATGKSALAPNQPKRVVVESTATTYAGRWVIRTSTAHRDRTC